MIRVKPLTIQQQASMLRKFYPGGKLQTFHGNILIWRGKLKSSPIGELYDVKLTYKNETPPNMYVTNPTSLPLAKNAKELPHIYDQKKQKLCLYYPGYREWNSTQMIAKTIIPWTIEWLYHYEIWLITGAWHGGGIHLNIKK